MANQNTGANAAGYRVLARKYRPQDFTALIGQEAMVRTLTNAFATGRVAQAYMLTGVRGIGKTTTARLIARALNYPTGPSIDMPEMTAQCEAILESRHIDVIEMDAASNTGVDNMREIIESVRYAPLEVRTKVYIIDEVHMLSKSAFNALLKTLEEPPPHVKFIFATTEIRKVPVTILSRCQRFDLKRMEAATLMQLYAKVAKAENVEIEEEALRMIARAAEGSARDGLSLLDQAIAYGDGTVKAADVEGMLGIVDRTRVIDLFDHVMAGNPAAALAAMNDQIHAGADPETILEDMADFVHWVTRLKLARDSALSDGARTETEKSRGQHFADKLTMLPLTRAWQMLLKGLQETATAPNPQQAAEMVLIRLSHAMDMPPSDELARIVKSAPLVARDNVTQVPTRSLHTSAQQDAPARMTSAAAPALARAQDAPPVAQQATTALTSFADILNLAQERRDVKLKTDLERQVRPISVGDGKIEIALEVGAAHTLPGELTRKLEAWTGRRWMVVVSKDGGAVPVAQQRRAAEAEALREARAMPVVEAILKAFPGAEITKVTDLVAPITLPTEDSDEESL